MRTPVTDFHAFDRPRIAWVRRLTDEGTKYSNHEAILGFYLQRQETKCIEVVYVNTNGREIPTTVYFVTWPELDAE